MSRRYQRWEKGVFALTQRMDTLLLRLVVTGAILLLVTQIALRSSLLLSVLSRVDRLEGGRQPDLAELAPWERFLAEKASSNSATTMMVSLQLLHPRPSATIKLLVNGEIRGSFARSTLDVGVKAGDLLEIDAMEEGDPVTIRVAYVSPEILKPLVGQYLQAKQEIRPLGMIELESGR